MKRYCLFLFLIFSAALTFAAPDPYAHLILYSNIDKTFFQKIVNGKEATYMVCTEPAAIGKRLTEETASQMFSDSINNWLDRTKYYITKTNRKNEFKDILDIVENKDNIKEIPCRIIDNNIQGNDADLVVFYTNDPIRFCDDVTSCFMHQGVIIIYSPSKKTQKKYIRSISHELGHAFGLADQYSGQTYKGSFLYNSKVKRPSIMDISKKITCDDVDGFITSVDRTLEKGREFYSLCSDGVFIKNGQAVTKNNKTHTLNENYEYFDIEARVSYDKDLTSGYILDMTLTNFILSDQGLDLIKNMGFDVADLKTLKNVQVAIHGLTLETFDFDNKFRSPIGLWTLVLSVKKGPQLQQKQLITIDYYGEDETPIFTDLDTNSSKWLPVKIQVPMINYFPYKGYGRKERLRQEFPFRFLKSHKKKNNKKDPAILSPGNIGEQIEDVLNTIPKP